MPQRQGMYILLPGVKKNLKKRYRVLACDALGLRSTATATWAVTLPSAAFPQRLQPYATWASRTCSASCHACPANRRRILLCSRRAAPALWPMYFWRRWANRP